jgi:hypothetical protein
VPVPEDVAKRLTRAVKLLSKWRDERDRLIVEAHNAGGGPREIARLAGVSHPTVIQIVRNSDAAVASHESGTKDPKRQPWRRKPQ